jgi:hypothetical protein
MCATLQDIKTTISNELWSYLIALIKHVIFGEELVGIPSFSQELRVNRTYYSYHPSQ